MKKSLLLIAALLPLGLAGEKIDFDKVQFWTGEGENRAALLVQFDTPDPDSPGALVWGYRWPKGQTAYSADMIRAIVANSRDICILVQYTGWMGETLDGIGFASDVSHLLDALYFDYDGAMEDGRISFGYVTPNTGMGQTSAPGSAAIGMSLDAIEAARDTHIIDHPLNQKVYGYPAYDYDFWKLDASRLPEGEEQKTLWRSGWYDGYWSFWVSGDDTDDLQYSGLGMSSMPVEDGQISGWKYQILDGPVTGDFDASTGASAPWGRLNYTHKWEAASVASVRADSTVAPREIYDLQGRRVATVAPGIDLRLAGLAPGIYVVRQGSDSKKLQL